MPQRTFKPADIPQLMPYLTVTDPASALAFWEKAFGFQPRTDMILRDAQGQVMHAEARFGEVVVMLGPQGVPSNPTHTPETTKVPSPVGLYVYCPDVDAIYQRAIAAGATSDMQPTDMFWGDRMCSLRDPDGHRWSFATQVTAFDPSKVPT